MAKTKLKIAKVTQVNPKTDQKGFSARVVSNGKAGYEEIVKEACHNTTLHKAEAKVALELCMESAANMLKTGMIVDLGPLGRLYPKCNSGWYENAEDLKLSDIKLGLYFRPAEDVEAAIKGASLVWAKADEEENEDEPGTPEEPGGEEPGGNSGGNGGNEPGGDEPGGDEPGGDEPGGGETPGGGGGGGFNV